jgi:hypothetical protein
MNMDDIYSSSTVLLAHSLQISSGSAVCLLLIMFLFVFGLSLFRKSFKMPQGLFISSLISYMLVLVNILELSFGLPIPMVVGFPFFAVIYPYSHIVSFIGRLTEWRWIILNQEVILYLVAFIANTLCIFAIIRLFLYIRQHKKPQVKQAV